MMGLPEMSNFLLGDSMDDVESSDNLTYAQTIMQIFYFVVETLQKEATNQENSQKLTFKQHKSLDCKKIIW